MSNEERRKLELDCNSLNAIAMSIRYEGHNHWADVLLTIEKHIFELIDQNTEK